MKKLLVISTTRTKNVETMLDAIRASLDDVQVDYTTYDDMVISFIAGEMRVLVENTGRDLAEYDMAYFKSSVVYDITAAYIQYAMQHDVKVTDPAKAVYPGVSKLYAYSLLVHSDIAVPTTLFTMPARLIEAYDLYETTLGLPFVLKGIHASRGDVNEVVRGREDFERITRMARDKKHYIIGQSFVPNEGDLRILVFGGKVQLVIHRMREDDTTHLNNTSQGGTATMVPVEQVPQKVIDASNKAAKLLGLGIAGVDMVQDKETGNWYCFEVNEGPQMATGSHRQAKWDALTHYLKSELEH